MKPHFYVNVADIETLESEVSYIACMYIMEYNLLFLESYHIICLLLSVQMYYLCKLISK
jgi:hypothetical protein